MFKSFFWSRGRAPYAYLGALGLIVIILLQVRVATVFNWWNGFFTDTLQHATTRPLSDLWWGVILFGLIGLADMTLGIVSGFLGRVYALWWRTATTEYYTERWRNCHRQIEGASQRIQEDPRELPGGVDGLVLDVFRAGITLWAFIPMLNGFNVPMSAGFFGWNLSLVEIAGICSVLGMAISAVVGAWLPGAEYRNAAAEAAFRKQLALAEEHRPLLDENGGWRALFNEVRANQHRLYLLYGYNDCWGTTYAKIMMVLPYILCLPYLHAGVVTFAFTMMTVNAFGQVQGAFSTFLRNWAGIMHLWSVVRRMREFQQTLNDTTESFETDNIIPLSTAMAHDEPTSEAPDDSVFRELSMKSRLH